MEIQKSSENNNFLNECCHTNNKTNSINPYCSNDPIAEAKSFLERSFFTTLTAVHVEKLKNQIEKEWGSTIDKAVDLTIKKIAKQ